MTTKRLAFPGMVVLAIAAAACSGGGGGGSSGGSGSGSLSGTIGGSSVTVRSAITAPVDFGGGVKVQAIILTDASNACATISAGKQPPSAQLLIFEIGTVNGSSVEPPTATGTFHLFNSSTGPTDPNIAAFIYDKSDANCTFIASASSTSGTVTISSMSGGSFVGGADLLTDGGDSISATFTAANCPALGPLLASPNPPPCAN